MDPVDFQKFSMQKMEQATNFMGLCHEYMQAFCGCSGEKVFHTYPDPCLMRNNMFVSCVCGKTEHIAYSEFNDIFIKKSALPKIESDDGDRWNAI